ncbi:MAG: AAA family ATPase [Selenomonadaceae bacterium]|nr:AAA family ATPase [Selenomonadaceae bacterium]
MRIRKIRWWNYRGLDDGEIVADGADVIVRGQNGVGKTSIASIVPFVLFGKDKDKVRRYEDGMEIRDDGLLHGAEVEFDDGTNFRYEVDGKNGFYYVDGELMTKTIYDVKVAEFLNHGGEYVLNPFFFCEGKSPKIQRNTLEKIFGTVSDKDILSTSEFEELAQEIGEQSFDAFITSTQSQIKNLRGKLTDIPARIDEIDRQLADNPYDAKVAESLQAERDELDRERKALQTAESEVAKELSAAKAEYKDASANVRWVAELERYRKSTEQNFVAKKNELLRLRKEFKAKRDEKPGICPTCKQPRPADAKFKARHEQELAELKDQGLTCLAEYEALKESLENITAEIIEAKKLPTNDEHLAALNERIKTLEQQVADEKVQRTEQLAKLDADIKEVDRCLQDLESAAKARKRIEELRAEEKELNQRIVDLEHLVRLAKDARNRKIELTESQIAGHFEHVKFKMFKLVVSTGVFEPTCEAMLHGVPYSLLSKGEKLKCVLDIFRALQKKFKVEMPLLIDDAESYTRNSFVDLPNQLWLFKVSDEEQLVIEIKKEARRAA